MIYDIEGRRVQILGEPFIAPNATLIGSVLVEDAASIWFNVVIRADNDQVRIGAESNLQDGSVLHVDPGFPQTIGCHVTVGHRVILHGCEIGDGSLIGMGAVVLNGARIGQGCLIGANALVTKRMEVPDGAVALGSPGRVVRTLDAVARQKLRESALCYIENGRRYRQHLQVAGGG